MKLLNEKKGLERWMLMTIIFAIFGFAIILWYFYITKPYTEVDREACAASIVLRSAIFVGESLKASTPLNCRTEQVKIDNRYKTDEQIKKRIVDAMDTCWSMVGKGEMNFMPKDFLSEEYCLICSSIQFDEKTRRDFPVITGFLDYMNKTKVPGQEISYYNYFFGNEATLKKMSDFEIDTSNDYAVLFVLYKAGTFTPKIFNIIGGSVGLGLGLIFPPAGVAGAVIYTVAGYSGTSFLSFYSTSAGKVGFYLIPYKGKEIEKYCTRFENAP